MKRRTYMITLSPTEKEIMEVLWKSEGMTNNDIVLCFREKGKDWKRQTTSTFLTRLLQKGVVVKEGHKYRAGCTKKEFEQRQTREILDSLYGGSLSNFIEALTGGGKMTKEEAEELEDLLRSEKEK